MSARPSGRKKAPVRDATPDKAFGVVLRRARLDQGLTQEQLSWKTGVERAFLSELERGVKGASVNMLFRLAQGLGVPASRLISDAEGELGR